MKKIVLLALVPLLFTGCDSNKPINSSEIPVEISAFITEFFPDNKIIQALKDKDGLELTYDITLDQGIFLEFNRKKKIIDIESNSKLPDAVIPEKLLKFANEFHKDQNIIAWELDDRKQQIKLDNGLELKFKLNGEFLKIDK